jgi:predicted signal transduction protein with EAL and GGDEF domain
VTTSRYSVIKHRKLGKHLETLEMHDRDLMDLGPEVQLLRALVIDFVERYDDFVEALLQWYAEQDGDTRPRKIVDIQEAGTLIEKVARIVKTMHSIQQSGSITLVTFKRVMESMGLAVSKYVEDPSVLQAIEDEWSNLPLDAVDPADRYDREQAHVEQDDSED